MTKGTVTQQLLAELLSWNVSLSRIQKLANLTNDELDLVQQGDQSFGIFYKILGVWCLTYLRKKHGVELCAI